MATEASEIVNKLKATRLPMVAEFEKQIQEEFITEEKFVMETRVLASYADQGTLLKDVYAAACRSGLFELLIELSPRDIMNFAHWVKNGEGKQIVERQQRENKLKRKAIAGHTFGDVASVELLDAEARLLSQEIKRTKAKYEKLVDELRTKITKAQREMDNALKNLDEKYMAAARYKCYKYVQKHVTEYEMDDQIVRKQKAEFCKEDLIRQHLKEFCEWEIEHYERIGKERQLEKFGTLLEILSGEERAQFEERGDRHADILIKSAVFRELHTEGSKDKGRPDPADQGGVGYRPRSKGADPRGHGSPRA